MLAHSEDIFTLECTILAVCIFALVQIVLSCVLEAKAGPSKVAIVI
jgi:hypothetical protein